MTIATGRRVYVYGLSSTEDGLVRYIGQTIQEPRKRLATHRLAKRRYAHTPVVKWVNDTKVRGFSVLMSILDGDAIWSQTECEIIHAYRQDGYDLLNSTDGGDGRPGFAVSEDVRSKISLGNKGKPKSVAHRLALSIAHRGQAPSQAARDAHRAKFAGKAPKNWQDIIDRRRATAKPKSPLKGRAKSDETRRKISEAKLGNPLNLTAESRALFAQYARERLHTPESRAKQSIAMTGRRLSADSVAKRQANRTYLPWTEEQRAERSLQQKEIWKKRREISFVE